MTDNQLQTNRFIAMAIDVGIAIAIAIVFIVIGVAAAFAHLWLSRLVYLALGIVLCGFYAMRDCVLNGNSIGKHLMKIKVVSVTGGPISAVQSVKRNLVWTGSAVLSIVGQIVSWVPFLSCLYSILMVVAGLAVLGYTAWEVYNIVTDPDGVRWGDKFAGTRVVRAA